VACSYAQINNLGETKVFGYREETYLKGQLCAFEYEVSNGHPIPVPIWNKLYRLSFLRENGIRCIPKQLNEDAWFTFQVILSAKNVILCPKVTYNYYVRIGSTCNVKNASEERRQFLTNQYIDICSLKKVYTLKFRGNEFYSSILEYAMNECIGHCVAVIRINTYYLLENYSSNFIKKIFMLIRIYTDRRISLAVSKMLRYPENKEYIDRLPEKEKKQHRKFYKISNCGIWYKLSFLAIGLAKKTIKSR
jgi:hypothetical protein